MTDPKFRPSLFHPDPDLYTLPEIAGAWAIALAAGAVLVVVEAVRAVGTVVLYPFRRK